MINDEGAWTGRFTCSEEIDAYVAGSTVQCLLCWRIGIVRLAVHVKREHQTDLREYRARFGIPPKRSLVPVKSFGFRWNRRSNIDWGLFLKRISAGEKQGEVCKESNMPSLGSVWLRRSKDKAFDTLVAEALEGRPGARITERTVSKIEEGLRAGLSFRAMGPSLPSKTCPRTGLLRLRKQNESVRARIDPLLKFGIYRPATYDWSGFKDRIAAGEGLYAVFDSSASMPGRGGWRAKLRSDPEFASTIHGLRAHCRRSLKGPRTGGNVKAVIGPEQFRAALSQDEIYAAVNAAVPRHLPPFMREDVVSDLILAMLDGAIIVEDIKAEAKRQVTAYNRAYSTWAPSLDAPIGDGSFTLGTSLAASYT